MKGNKKTAAWGAALCALAAALFCFNFLPPGGAAGTAAAEKSYTSGAPLGSQPGQQLPDFTLTQMDGAAFHLTDQRGRATVLNLWATWCTPCVNELPHFDRLQGAYPDEVAVLAIHSNLVTDDVEAYLRRYDYRIPFAIDETGEVVQALGGSLMLPQTVILNPYGEVTYNQVGSLTYEALEELVKAALEASP